MKSVQIMLSRKLKVTSPRYKQIPTTRLSRARSLDQQIIQNPNYGSYAISLQKIQPKLYDSQKRQRRLSCHCSECGYQSSKMKKFQGVNPTPCEGITIKETCPKTSIILVRPIRPSPSKKIISPNSIRSLKSSCALITTKSSIQDKVEKEQVNSITKLPTSPCISPYKHNRKTSDLVFPCAKRLNTIGQVDSQTSRNSLPNLDIVRLKTERLKTESKSYHKKVVNCYLKNMIKNKLQY